MRIHRALVALLLVTSACKKKDADKAPAPATASGSAAAAPEGSAAAAGSAAAPAPAAPAGPHTLVLDKLGMQVDAPGCGEITNIDEHTQSVTPNDPSCVVPFPGAVFTSDSPDAGKSLEEDVKMIGASSQIVRKDKTQNGWVLETKDAEGARYTQRYTVGGHLITCAAQLGDDAAKNDILKKICLSARPKT